MKISFHIACLKEYTEYFFLRDNDKLFHNLQVMVVKVYSSFSLMFEAWKIILELEYLVYLLWRSLFNLSIVRLDMQKFIPFWLGMQGQICVLTVL